MFYKYVYYKTYSLLEDLKVSSAHSIATVAISALLGMLIFRIQSFTNSLYNHSLKYEDIAIPYIIVFSVIYLTNYLLLQRGANYLKTESFFKDGKQPKHFNLLLAAVTIFVLVILVL